MKKVLIISQAMEIGGAERALLGLLNSFDYSNYQVDLFLCRQTGELLNQIPKQVHVLPENQARYLAIPMKILLKEKQFRMLYGRLKGKYLAKRKVKKLSLQLDNQVELIYSHKYTYSYMDFINPDQTYDIAISFLTPHYICLNRCRAKKKLAWIHTDYTAIDIDVETEWKMWSSFDRIVSISDQCTEAFLKKFPSLEKKIIRIDNIITKEMIERQAKEPIKEQMGQGMNLLSIGRFSYAKNFDNVPAICQKILKTGLDVTWYLIGYGGEEELIKSKIVERNMEDRVILLGKKENPYPYLKACDFYIQPSRYEGKAVTVREAQILEKPVIITAYPTSSSQLEDGIDGIIVPMENEGCAKGIAEFIQDETMQGKILSNLKQRDYSNANEVEKIYQLMEE